MTPPLKWQSEDNNTRRARKRPLTYYLFAGEIHVATLTPSASGERYVPHVILPGCARIAYYELDRAKAAVERVVTLWFEAAFRNEDENEQF